MERPGTGHEHLGIFNIHDYARAIYPMPVTLMRNTFNEKYDLLQRLIGVFSLMGVLFPLPRLWVFSAQKAT